jgi:methylated-DNA-[protein]-cysteine S-methyltransferase
MAHGLRSTRVVETPLGRFGVEATSAGVASIRLPGDGGGAAESEDGAHGVSEDSAASAAADAAAIQLAEYARGDRREFDLTLDWIHVRPEHRRVLETLLTMAPYGRIVTYGELGARAGVDDPRDVGVHMNRNPLPIVVPCHRVVAADGLGGYGGGLALKRRLLELEGGLPPSLDLGDL